MADTLLSEVPVWSGEQGWNVSPEPRTLIGALDGPPEYQFGSIGGIGRLTGGRIVVADRMLQVVRLYTPEGVHYRTIGGKGNGPGEFKLIDWLGVSGDSIYAWDPFAASLTVFDSSGTFARSHRFDAAQEQFRQVVGIMGTHGLVMPVPRRGDRSGRAVDGVRLDSVTYELRSFTGEPIRTLGSFLRGEQFGVSIDRLRSYEEVIFGRSGRVTIHPEGLVSGETGALAITYHSPEGAQLRTAGRRHTPVAAKQADVAAVRERLGRSGGVDRVMPQMARVQEKLITELPHRSVLPAFETLLVDEPGNVWLWEFQTDRSAGRSWSVFDPHGRWLGQVHTPPGLQVRAIGADWLMGVVVDDDLGVQRLALHDLHKP